MLDINPWGPENIRYWVHRQRALFLVPQVLCSYAKEHDLKGHLTKGCKYKPGSRIGSASEKALIKEKIKGLHIQKDVGKVHCEEHLFNLLNCENVFHFCYLRADFQVDGDQRQAAIIRLGMAKTIFGKMMHIWKSDLALAVKMTLYQAAIILWS
jgi:hypothetical protein